MDAKIVTDFHSTYKLNNNNFIFSIDVLLKPPKKIPPFVTFTVKNIKSKLVVTQSFAIYNADWKLTSKFLLYFRNTFGSYMGENKPNV